MIEQQLLDDAARSGLTLLELADPRTRLPQTVLLADLALYMERFGRSDLGLLAAQATMPGNYGAVELAARACETVRQAFVVLAHGFGLIADGIHLAVEERGKHVAVRFWTEPDLVLPSTITEFQMLSLVVLGSSYIGKSMHPDLVRFAHPKVPHAAVCAEAFGCNIEFDSVENALLFSPALLDVKLPTADRLAGGMLRQRVDALALEATGNDLIARVEQAVASKLSGGMPTLASIAQALGTSVRTLHRSLAESGTNYRELCDRLRLRLALHYLESSDLSIKEIASALGFSEVQAFHRAYKRMTGNTPKSRRVDRLAG